MGITVGAPWLGKLGYEWVNMMEYWVPSRVYIYICIGLDLVVNQLRRRSWKWGFGKLLRVGFSLAFQIDGRSLNFQPGSVITNLEVLPTAGVGNPPDGMTYR